MDELEKQAAIRLTQAQQLFAASTVSLVSSAILAGILVYAQRNVIDHLVLALWFSCVLLASLSRAALVKIYQHQIAPVLHTWMSAFRVLVLFAGIVWGGASFLLFPDHHPQHQMVLVVILLGLTSGAMSSFSADSFSASAFLLITLTPLMLRLFTAQTDTSTSIGIALTLYLVFMLVNLQRINRNLLDNITLRFEADANVETVRASEERYRLLLTHSPVGIFHYDTQLTLTYCNDRFGEILKTTSGNLIGLNMSTLKDQSVLPALRAALQGEVSFYEGHYHATLSAADGWVAMNCAPYRNHAGYIVGGIAIVQDISRRKAAEKQIEHLAFFDPLTSLPNRRLLLDRLEHALAASNRNGLMGALLFIDLDNFKILNDTLGHDLGDLLLKQVAERLLTCVEEGDSVARLGGDEFVVILEGLSKNALDTLSKTKIVAQAIHQRLGKPYPLRNHVYYNSASIGATLFNNHAQSLDELLKQADIAMYQAKKAGRNTLRFFDPAMQEAINNRAALEASLREALTNNGLHLYFQVQVDEHCQTIGAEVLIRWPHPQRGLISPADFIPLAEETQLILQIGDWVLDRACEQLARWETAPNTQHLMLAVNVSAKQFRQNNFVAQVQAAVHRHHINPARLKLELTESMLLDNIDDTIATMRALRELGVKISLDDFGTGYSSLQYLKRLPLDQIKIDQSFVRDLVNDPSDQAIVRTIIAMALGLKLNVIAEGVETNAQREFLLAAGCKQYQGYFFGLPTTIEQFMSRQEHTPCQPQINQPAA